MKEWHKQNNEKFLLQLEIEKNLLAELLYSKEIEIANWKAKMEKEK